MQGNDRSGATGRILLLMLVAVVSVGGLEGVEGAAYPDTFTCKETPTIEFPDTVTLSNEYFFFANCGSVGTQSGDFVSIDIAAVGGYHIKDLSKYEITDAGIEWVSPLSDSNGNVWGLLDINPGEFDCNATGIPYIIHVHWDGHEVTQNFDVVCPIIEFDFYRIEVPNWEHLRVTASVTDNKGHAMRNLPCTASVLDISTDGNFITIKQENVNLRTDMAGKVRYQIETGLLNDLLQGYEYTVNLSCMGGDGNFTFTIEEMNPETLRNPLYFTIVFLSDNIIPIVLALIVATMAVGGIYFIFKRG